MKGTVGVFALIGLLGTASPGSAQDASGWKGVTKLGLNSIWIADYDTSEKFKKEHGGKDALTYELDLFQLAGAHVCRVDMFELSGGFESFSSTKRGKCGKTWAEVADEVFSGLAKRGIAAYCLLNLDLGKGDEKDYSFLGDTTQDERAGAFVDRFASACEELVGRYRERCHVFEVVNEPNNKGIVDPAWQALILQKVYEHAKWAHRLQDVVLVSGPLFTGWDGQGDDASSWMEKLYLAGRRLEKVGTTYVSDPGWSDPEFKRAHPKLLQLDWSAFYKRAGTYPFDGVGYHVYVLSNYKEKGQVVGPSDVKRWFDTYMDAVEKVVQRFDPDAARKKIWISEFGWHAGVGTAHDEGLTREQALARQRDMIVAAFRAVLDEDRVAAMLYFCLQDFVDPGSHKIQQWGLVGTSGGPESLEKRPAFSAFAIVEAGGATESSSQGSAAQGTESTPGFTGALNRDGE